ncbi:MAG: TfoX/Sxy family protein [Chitinophagales bacterium]|nr:TfoX/Sxy family protein [Chitinophagales bacterium]
MAYNPKLATRVREALTGILNVEEKRMFRGIAFMVNGKMCISVGDDEIMCRIDPALHNAAVEKKGCRTVKMRGREYKGWVLISKEGMKSKKDLNYWISLALDFNVAAKATKKRK